MTRRDPASERQVQAAAPSDSVWLSANAGSGKTKVLTDRVARLLLAGTEPQKVLCLTYTKAAATEMQNRLLKRLGAWAMLGNAELRQQLTDLGEDGVITDAHLAQARRLFAKAIETPGGLKIQTIHSFCAALLRRFPLESGVPHGFAEIDDRSAAVLRADILEELVQGPDAPLFDAVARYFSGSDIADLLAEISQHRDCFSADLNLSDMLEAFGLPRDYTPASLPQIAFDGSEADLVQSVAPVLMGQSKTMQDLARNLQAVDWTAPDAGTFDTLFNLFLYKDGGLPRAEAKTASIPTKKAVEALGEDLTEAFHAFMERIARARGAQLGFAAAQRSFALHQFARSYLPRLAARKAARGWLDFDDLIERAAALLSNPSVAQWVLFRIDGGIDHILVDEAQDTSPGQWTVIERLTDEFTAGEGARGERRTIFVVGDRKQSIYSFQGADLLRFEAMQRLFSEKFAAVERPLLGADLLHSFRSSYAILRLTDLTFSALENDGLGGAPEHLAFHDRLPGRVDLWPPVPKSEKPAETDWENPIDLRSEHEERVVLARKIAAEIRAMIDSGTQIPLQTGQRPVHEGDFLILVQRRGPLFAEIIRACKAAGLTIAGADRLKLGAELAVKDIRAVLTFLATPEDDLALAEALRSPLFGWTEAELYRLAQPRKGYLWQALRENDAIHPGTLEILQDLRDRSDFLRPFDLIERLLNNHRGRDRLIARLGREAEDGIDELVTQALSYEQTEVPSLTGFLVWLAADDVEVKRQLEGGGRAIRVMTVHGAKGLEAPIVILPDTAKGRGPRSHEIYPIAPGMAGWHSSAALAPETLRGVQELEAQRLREEKMRLLYVALTRAEKWLIVAAAGETGSGEDSWYALIEEGMKKAGTETVHAQSAAVQELGPVQRFSHGSWPEAGAAAVEDAPEPAPPLPDWLDRHAPRPAPPLAPLSPSDLGGPKALPGEENTLDQDAAKRRGRLLHSLLEHLPSWPRATWPDLARELLSGGEDRATSDEIETFLADAVRILTLPEMADYLGPDALAEVEITAPIAELDGRQIHGIIDRLVITPNRIRVLDYKSNAVVPATAQEVPPGIVRQMAAYRAALQQIYPQHAIDCCLLWTATGQITRLTDTQLDAALRSATPS
ncbi:double-strand break repair helicase AddA [Paenirhodobacter sp. CAU 1674]|uniref:double-strand break repair helicase AddA n=1 Tax=Paenirhodobacter sp. CAU 1674 TaxID=3032596 RepID=UPI0023DB55D5|nr:double-strand break repair helicase AddA [Paenirhodobacter sp. CAU 1674]MDF2141910.1 double-strand break repair helicase AddA [Paenirhodobacter sp. CAU 1674]